jgi:predicted GH43/DUF377 family glycosyl hydrolase
MILRFAGLMSFLLFGFFALDGCSDFAGQEISQSAAKPGGPVRSVHVPESRGQSFNGLTKTGTFFQGTIIASDPTIVKVGNGLRMYYTDLNVDKLRTVIATATSADGTTWSTEGSGSGVSGIALDGRDGMWDENIESASIIRVGGSWKLYYSGYRDKGNPFKGFPAAMGLAISTDGQNFKRVSDSPILNPTPGWYDNDAVYSSTVYYENGTYYMIYVGHAYTNTSKIDVGGVYLLGATSKDGINWAKKVEPIARPYQFPGWRSDGLAEPYLVKGKDGKFYLFFTGLQGEQRNIGVGVGNSPHGPFEFSSAPILKPGKRGTPDESLVLAPAVMLDGDNLRMWYLASTKGEILSIGEATGSLSNILELSN